MIKKRCMEEVQKQAEKISTILKNSGYRAELIALSKDVGTAINAFGTRKDALNTINLDGGYSVVDLKSVRIGKI